MIYEMASHAYTFSDFIVSSAFVLFLNTHYLYFIIVTLYLIQLYKLWIIIK